ncbi:MAG: glycolate oxidase subunit GlcE [Pseudomonadota bacterium]
MSDRDDSKRIVDAIKRAAEDRTPLNIRGSGSKDFYGHTSGGEPLDVTTHGGILNYQPGELVITARGGTPLREVEAALAEQRQYLPFEPPHFGDNATLGGAIASGLSGPRRPWSGAARDLVLGTRIVNGRGEELRFGGEVMKNVAGYDISRLMTGSLGTLGVLLDISLKVLPVAEYEITLTFELDASEALSMIARHARTPIPLTGAAHVDGVLYLRLAGARDGVEAAHNSLGGDTATNDAFWRDLREQQLDFFTRAKGNLWRWSCAPNTALDPSIGEILLDWGGAQRWFFSETRGSDLRAQFDISSGHLQCFRLGSSFDENERFHPLSAATQRINDTVKKAFDPYGIFNPGRLFPLPGH